MAKQKKQRDAAAATAASSRDETSAQTAAAHAARPVASVSPTGASSSSIPVVDNGSDESVCAVCNSGISYDDDQILFCDGCDVAVHQSCYAVAEVPEGDWFCYACAAEEKRDDPQWRPRCVLCPVEGGAFMRVYDGDAKPRGDGDQWAHVACAAWINETAINVTTPIPSHTSQLLYPADIRSAAHHQLILVC